MALSTLARLGLIRDYVSHRTDGLPGPSVMLLETTNRCNLACPMCPRTHIKQWNRDMPDDVLWPTLDAFAAGGGDHVLLYGLGEPLLDERLPAILERCRQLGLGTVLSTNGILLDQRRRRWLLDNPCDHLLIGIDGHTEAVYDRYRPGGGLDRVRAQVEALAAEKVALGADLVIVVQLIRLAHNQHEVDDFSRYWRSVDGVDLVRIKEEDIGIDEHRTWDAEATTRRNACPVLWRGALVVRASGDVYGCYHLADVERQSPLGNLADHTLLELWNHPRLAELRRMHGEGTLPADSPCARCPSARPRLPFIVGAMALPGTTTRKLLPLLERAALRVPAVLSERRERR